MMNEETLECSVCGWVGQEAEAIRVDEPAEDWYYNCPKCGEVCAHIPIDELPPVEQAEDSSRIRTTKAFVHRGGGSPYRHGQTQQPPIELGCIPESSDTRSVSFRGDGR